MHKRIQSQMIAKIKRTRTHEPRRFIQYSGVVQSAAKITHEKKISLAWLAYLRKEQNEKKNYEKIIHTKSDA